MAAPVLTPRAPTAPVGAPIAQRKWPDIALVALVVFISAGPTLWWAVVGGDLLTDDWWMASTLRHQGFWSSFTYMAWDFGRPLAALTHSVYYTVIGPHPLPLLLLLAGINAAAAVLVLRLGRRLLPSRAAVLTALVWAALPNRGSVRLWIVMLPVALALLLLLGAGLLLARPEPRYGTASVLIALGGLAYEAVIPLGVAALVYTAWKRGRRRWRDVAESVAPPLASAAYVFLRSPKRTNGIAPFSTASRLLPANLGVGIFGGGTLSILLATAVLVLIVVALVRATLPTFGPSRSHHRVIVVGCGILFLGALPFLAAGFPFGTDGIFDRGNIISGLGVAMILAGCGEWLLRSCPRRAGAAVLALGVGSLALLNGQDVHDYRAAVSDGKALVAALDHDLPTIPNGGVLVVPALPNRGGVAMFILEADLASKLWLDRGGPTAPPIRIAPEGQAAGPGAEAYVYDWRTRTLSTIDSRANRTP
jgi:hypothetical protein